MAELQVFEVTEPFLDLKCGLGESPFWEEEDNVLRFVDIVHKKVYRVDLDKVPSSLQQHQYENAVCITGKLASSKNEFIFGGKYGIGIGDKNSNTTRLLKSYWSDEERKGGKDVRMRANDGAVDSKGRFWVSTLVDPETSQRARGGEGHLFRLNNNGHLDRVLSGLTIPNGMSWSKDNKTLYLTDTAEGTVFSYDFDEKSGSISNKKAFFTVKGDGGPDGHAQDEEENLWIAVWGHWKVVRVSPKGEVTAEIRLPTRCPTAVAFAGDEVYITSEREHEPEKYPENLKYHGGVFRCRVGTRGQRPRAAIIQE